MALIPIVDIEFRWMRVEGTQSPRITLQYRTGIDVLTVLTWGDWMDIQEMDKSNRNAIREIEI